MNSETRYLLFISVVYGISALILQSVFVPIIEINGWKPDLVLVLVLLIGKRFGSVGGSSAGFFLGIIQDALTSMPIGITALPKAIAGYGTGKIKSLKLEGSMNIFWFILFVFLHELIFYIILQFKLDVNFTYLLYSRVFPNTLYSTAMLYITQFFTQKTFADEQS